MLIRDEHNNDVDRISQIQYAAFKGHPMHQPGAEPTEDLIVEHLRTTNALSLSLLAEEEGEAIGHIAMSPATVGEVTQGWYLLGPVGVIPSRQRDGIGSALVRESLQQMQKKGAEGVVLVGDPEFYKRFGFKSMSGLTYHGVPDQFVLGLSFTDKEPKGEIITHDAFHRSNVEVKSRPKESKSPRGMHHYLSVKRRV